MQTGKIKRTTSRGKDKNQNEQGTYEEVKENEQVVINITLPSNSSKVVKNFVEKFGAEQNIIKPSHKVACLNCPHAVWATFEPFEALKEDPGMLFGNYHIEEAQLRCFCRIQFTNSWTKASTEVTDCDGKDIPIK